MKQTSEYAFETVIEKEMLEAAKNREFEKAATLRDQLKKLREQFCGAEVPDVEA